MIGREEVDKRLEAFEQRYGDFVVKTNERTVSHEDFERGVSDVRSCEVVDVRVWVEHEGAVLLLRDSSAPEVWTEPGGTVERDEDFEQTARREVAEETGIDCRVTELRAVCRHVLHDEMGSSRSVQLLQAFYRADYEAGDIIIQDEEVEQARWWSALPDEFYSVVGVPRNFSG